MSDKTDAVVAKLGDKALEYLDAFEKVIQNHSAEAVDAALKVVQINAAGNLALGFLCLTVVLINCFYFAPRGFKAIKENDESAKGIFYFSTTFFLTVASIPALIVVASTLFDVWEYVALIEPKLFLAKKMMVKFL